MDQHNNTRGRGLGAIRRRLTLALLGSVLAILASIQATLLGIFPA